MRSFWGLNQKKLGKNGIEGKWKILGEDFTFYIKFLCFSLTAKIHFNSFLEVTFLVGIIFYFDRAYGVWFDWSGWPGGSRATTASADIVYGEWLGRNIFEAKNGFGWL